MASAAQMHYFHLYTAPDPHALSFACAADYHRFLSQCQTLFGDNPALYAYCLLPTHLHLLLGVETAKQIPAVAEGIVARLPSDATVPAIHITPVPRSRQLSHLVVYIHQNITHHQFFPDFRQWRYTSWPALAGQMPTRLQRKTVLNWFSGRQWFEDAHWQPADEARIWPLIKHDDE